MWQTVFHQQLFQALDKSVYVLEPTPLLYKPIEEWIDPGISKGRLMWITKSRDTDLWWQTWFAFLCFCLKLGHGRAVFWRCPSARQCLAWTGEQRLLLSHDRASSGKREIKPCCAQRNSIKALFVPGNKPPTTDYALWHWISCVVCQ